MQSNSGSPRTEPPSTAQASVLFEFENFRLDPANRLFTCEGKEILLPGRVFDALLLFVRKPGDLITKEEMLTTVWHDSFVEESNLTVAISTLRRALNEDPQNRRYIQTVARRGYRFVAEVREIESVPRAAKPANPPPQSEDTDRAEPVAPADLESTPAVEPHARRWPLLVTVAVLLAGLLAGAWHLLKPRSVIRTLAVLPFTLDNSSGQASSGTPDEVVLLGMTDGLISHLDGDLVVRPTGSVLRYSTGAAVDPVAAGREQGVDAVLTGSVDTAANSEILHLRLLRVRDGLVLWQDNVSGTPDSLPQLEQNAGETVAHELHRLGAISAPPKTSAVAHPDGPAYQLYLRGRYFWNRRTVDGLRKSTDYFRQSIDADPNYAPAYAGLADSYALLASFSVEPGSSANADARSAALSAIHLDPALAEPHASLGMIYFFTDWNLSAAEQEFEHAIQLNPNYATAHHWYALDLAAMGRFPQALYEIHLAQKLDPLSLIIGTNVGWIEYLSHDNAAALVALNRVLELDPNFVRARTRLGMVEMAAGDYASAVTNLTQALTLSGNPEDRDPWVEGLLGDAEARAGNRAAAEKVLAELQKRAASHYVPPISRALVLIGLNRNAEAIEALGQAVDDHSTSMVYARVDPSLDPLRTDPAFQKLLERMKL